MGIARAFFDWMRDFSHFRWYYNPRRINVENGRNAVEQLLALSQVTDFATVVNSDKGKETAKESPVEAAGESVKPADRALEERSATPRNHDGRLECLMPAELNEVRQAYESKSIEYIERFRNRSAKAFATLETVCEKGVTNVGLMRNDLFSYLRTYALVLRYKILVWILFVAALIGLTALDVAPTLLVFEGMMEGDTVSIGRLLGISDEKMRDLILALATTGFLAGVVMMGHITAKLIAATYLDGEVPAFGIGLAAVMLALFITVAGLRYGNELRTQEENYASYVKEFEKRAVLGTSETKEALKIEQWKPGYMGRAAFHASMFVMISLMIFIVSVYVSLWRVYGDIRMITRRFKHIRYRVRIAGLAAELRTEHNALTNRWEKLRQSAQIEVEQFLAGVEQGMVGKNLEPLDRWHMQILMRDIARLFNKWLQLPEQYQHGDKVTLPENEEEWGMRYGVFLTETARFDTYSKGAMDAFNHGMLNPDSAVDSISEHRPAGSTQKLLLCVTPQEMLNQYQAGFIEGTNVPNSPAKLHGNMEAVRGTPDTKDAPAALRANMT